MFHFQPYLHINHWNTKLLTDLSWEVHYTLRTNVWHGALEKFMQKTAYVRHFEERSSKGEGSLFPPHCFNNSKWCSQAPPLPPSPIGG